MYEALMEIMEPKIKQREDAKIAEERKKGIQITVKSLKDFGVGEEEITVYLKEMSKNIFKMNKKSLLERTSVLFWSSF